VHEGALKLDDEAPESPVPEFADGDESHEAALRIGALLGLDERGGVFVLDLASAHLIGELAALAPTAQFVALASSARIAGAGTVILGCNGVIPLANGCASGIMLDRVIPELVRSAVQVLAPGGRLVAPAYAAVPDGVTVLARDERQWVAERAAAPALSSIRRAAR
jgi:hypothetical protein